jgi:hypothetical protein
LRANATFPVEEVYEEIDAEMSPGAAHQVVFVTRGEEERLEFSIDLLIYEEGLSTELNLSAERVIRGTPIGRYVANNVMLSAWFPF